MKLMYKLSPRIIAIQIAGFRFSMVEGMRMNYHFNDKHHLTKERSKHNHQKD